MSRAQSRRLSSRRRSAIDLYVWADRAIVPRTCGGLSDEFLQLMDKLVSDVGVKILAGIIKGKLTPAFAEIGDRHMTATVFCHPRAKRKFCILITSFGRAVPQWGRKVANSSGASWDDIIFLLRYTIEPDDGGSRLVFDGEMSEVARALMDGRRRDTGIGPRMRCVEISDGLDIPADAPMPSQIEPGSDQREIIKGGIVKSAMIVSVSLEWAGQFRGLANNLLHSLGERFDRKWFGENNRRHGRAAVSELLFMLMVTFKHKEIEKDADVVACVRDAIESSFADRYAGIGSAREVHAIRVLSALARMAVVAPERTFELLSIGNGSPGDSLLDAVSAAQKYRAFLLQSCDLTVWDELVRTCSRDEIAELLQERGCAPIFISYRRRSGRDVMALDVSTFEGH